MLCHTNKFIMIIDPLVKHHPSIQRGERRGASWTTNHSADTSTLTFTPVCSLFLEPCRENMPGPRRKASSKPQKLNPSTNTLM